MLFLLLLTTAVYGDDLPNIILIMADDLGWADVTPNNPNNHNTPHIAALARQGIRYTDYHSAAPVCTPSRAGLLTGRMGQRTGVLSNFRPSSIGGLPTTEHTMADYLKSVGYSTGIIGKWHLGHNTDYHPLSRGFDYYYGLPYSDDMGCVTCSPIYNIKESSSCPNEWNLAVPLYENRTIIEQPVDLTTLSARYAQKSKEFMSRSLDANQNFFLYVPMTHVHVPLATDVSFANKSKDGHFGDVLMEMDNVVGEITSFLQTRNIVKNTIVIFTSDNGPWEWKCQLAGSSAPFLGTWQKTQGQGGSTGKMTTWEGGHRVPFIISWPAMLMPGISTELVSALDILPTFAMITNFTLPNDRVFDGMPLPFLVPYNGTRTVYLQDLDLQEIWALRHGKHKIFYASKTHSDCNNSEGSGFQYHNPALIFDVESDPNESTPISNLPKEFYSRMEVLKKKLRDSIDTTFKSVTNYDKDETKIPCCNPDNLYCSCHSIIA